MVYYTDGSCNGNGKITNVGGFAVVEVNDDRTIHDAYAKRCANTTNNREELKAILRVMLTCGVKTDEWAQPPVVYSDSAYCVQTFNEWMFNWARNGWIKSDKKEPENLDLIKAYYDHYMKGYRIDLKKVKGHAGNKYNELADKLATGVLTAEEAMKIYG
jgi:ribonuclease HI